MKVGITIKIRLKINENIIKLVKFLVFLTACESFFEETLSPMAGESNKKMFIFPLNLQGRSHVS